MSKTDKRFLEFHGGKWRVVVPVPRDLQKKVGKTKLKKSLGTDSLTLANRLKWAVVSELKGELTRKEEATPADPLLKEALSLREAFERGSDDPDVTSSLGDYIAVRADEIQGDPVYQDPETGELEYDEERDRRAGYFFKVATGEATPLNALVHQWHTQEVNRKERTKGDDVRAINYLEEWCKDNRVSPTLEAITRKVAGRFIGDLPTIAASAQQGQKLTNKTANKYISSLSGYWKWLQARGFIEENVWRGQSLPKERTGTDDQERPFTDEEVKTLLSGSPPMKALLPIMKVAALSGARIDAIVSLRVKDCENGLFRFKPQKKETRERYVPIHSSLIALVDELKRGKSPEDDLFEGFPVPPPGSQRERSMPAVKAFGRYREAMGVDDRRPGKKRSLVNFHSFRRWFITKAERAGQPESTIASVVGHKRQGMTFGRYSGGPEMEQFRACVEAVRLPE
jgi:integrase